MRLGRNGALLGATVANVQALILGEVLKLITLGVSGGLLIAMAASQTIRSLLFISGPDVLTFILAPALLVPVAILACWLPVVRATRIWTNSAGGSRSCAWACSRRS